MMADSQIEKGHELSARFLSPRAASKYNYLLAKPS